MNQRAFTCRYCHAHECVETRVWRIGLAVLWCHDCRRTTYTTGFFTAWLYWRTRFPILFKLHTEIQMQRHNPPASIPIWQLALVQSYQPMAELTAWRVRRGAVRRWIRRRPRIDGEGAHRWAQAVVRRSLVAATVLLIGLLSSVTADAHGVSGAAIVLRYYATAGAGAADGTTHNDRAQLHNAGTWSTAMTGFAFNGADSQQANIEAGTHTISTNALASGLFANPPTAANPLLMVGYDTSGVRLALPDPDWLSCQPAWDNSTLPVLATTTNIQTINLNTVHLYLVRLTSSARVLAMLTIGMVEWCSISNSANSTNSAGLTPIVIFGSVVKMTATSYDYHIIGPNSVINCRIEGVAGSSGNRRGIVQSSNVLTEISFTTVVNCGGEACLVTSGGTTASFRIQRSVFANNGGTGVKFGSAASQASIGTVRYCMITGNVTGIDGNSAAGRVNAHDNRLRDNTTNITGLGNWPTDWNNYTTDSDDATEYVSTGADGDFSIKNTASAIWSMGYGVRDQPAGAVGGASLRGGFVN